MLLDGVKESLLKSKWLPDGTICYRCCSGGGICICPWEAETVSIKKLGLETLMVLQCILPEKEFEQHMLLSREVGPYAVLLALNNYVQRYTKLFSKKKAFYLLFLEKFKFTTLKYVCTNEFSDLAKFYNEMWQDIQKNKYDIVTYFASYGSKVKNEALWEAVDDPEAMRAAIEDNNPERRYAGFEFFDDYGSDTTYMTDSLFFDYTQDTLMYTVPYDQKRRGTYSREKGCVEFAGVSVPVEFYIMMIFGTFHNKAFRNMAKEAYTQIPPVDYFPEWIKVMKSRLDHLSGSSKKSRVEFMNLYMHVGVLYYYEKSAQNE